MRIVRWMQGVAAVSVLLVVVQLQSCSRPTEPAPSDPAPAAAPSAPAPSSPPLPTLEGNVIRDRLGAAITALAGGAISATLPRPDLPLRIEGTPAAAALELSTDVVFRPALAGASVAGSAALLEDEVNPVVDTLLAHGIRVVGLYNRFLFDEPRVLVLRFEAEGPPALLASGVQSIGSAVRDARLRSAQPLHALPGDAPGSGSLDAAALGGVFGVQARVQGVSVVVDVPRTSGALAGSAAPGSTAPPQPLLRAAFSGSDLRAAVDGRYVLASAELIPVLAALRAANVHLVGLVPQGQEGASEWFTLFVRGKGTSLALVRALAQSIQAIGASQ